MHSRLWASALRFMWRNGGVGKMRDPVSVDEVMASLPKERRARIEACGKDLIAHIEQCKAVPGKLFDMHYHSNSPVEAGLFE